MAISGIHLHYSYLNQSLSEDELQTCYAESLRYVENNKPIPLPVLESFTPKQIGLLALHAAKIQSWSSLLCINVASPDYSVVDERGRNILHILLDSCLTPTSMVMSIIHDCIAKGVSLHTCDNRGRTVSELLLSAKWEPHFIDSLNMLEVEDSRELKSERGVCDSLCDECQCVFDLTTEIYIGFENEHGEKPSFDEDDVDGVSHIVKATLNNFIRLRQRIKRRNSEDTLSLMQHRAPFAKERVTAEDLKSDWEMYGFDPVFLESELFEIKGSDSSLNGNVWGRGVEGEVAEEFDDNFIEPASTNKKVRNIGFKKLALNEESQQQIELIKKFQTQYRHHYHALVTESLIRGTSVITASSWLTQSVTEELDICTNTQQRLSGVLTGIKLVRILDIATRAYSLVSSVKANHYKFIYNVHDPEHRKELMKETLYIIYSFGAIIRNMMYMFYDILQLVKISPKFVQTTLSAIANKAPVVGLVVAILELVSDSYKLVSAAQNYFAMDKIEQELIQSAIDDMHLCSLLDSENKAFVKRGLKQACQKQPCLGFDQDFVNDARRALTVTTLKELNQKRIARKSFEVLIDIASIAENISLITGGTIISAGVFAMTTTFYVGALALRQVKQQIHNYRNDDKSAKAKHQEYCELISSMVEMLFTIPPPNQNPYTMRRFMAQVKEMQSLFKAAGFPMTSFLDERIPFNQRLQQLYNKLYVR